MAYQVLARKWRPRDFSSLVGQEHVVRALRHALQSQRLHHAYLLTGTRGVGKTTLARILAKCLNCETGVTAAPCGKCSACTEIDGGRFVDLLEVDAATNTRVDEMRQLLETAQYAPTRGRYKVYVIDEVHMLSNSAFNAMLKTLEEPPEHLKFILATTDPQKIPVTVLSRCLQFSLKQMAPESIREHLSRLLQAEGVPFEEDALPLVAKAANGSMRDALSILDQAIAHGAGQVARESVRDMLGTVDDSYLLGMLEAVVRGDADTVVSMTNEMQTHSLSFDAGLAGIASILLRVALLQLSREPTAGYESDHERLAAMAAQLDPEAVQLHYQIAVQGRSDLPLAPDEYSGFLMALVRMLAFRPDAGAWEASTSLPRRSGIPSAQASAAASERGQPALPAAAPVRVAPARVSGEAGPVGIDWPAIAKALPLSGAAKELARNAELRSSDNRNFSFTLPKSMAHLAERSYQDKLRVALEGVLQKPVSVVVEVMAAPSAGASLAALEAKAQARQHSEVRKAIEDDRFVKELVELFEGRVTDIASAGPGASASQGKTSGKDMA